MGRDKAFLEFHGESLLTRALKLAQSVSADVAIVGPSSKFAAFGRVVEDTFGITAPSAEFTLRSKAQLRT